MKLKEKTRSGSRVKKTSEPAQTPYQRVLASPQVPEPTKQHLSQQYARLNPADLKRQITRCQQQLFKLATRPEPATGGQARRDASRREGHRPTTDASRQSEPKRKPSASRHGDRKNRKARQPMRTARTRSDRF